MTRTAKGLDAPWSVQWVEGVRPVSVLVLSGPQGPAALVGGFLRPSQWLSLRVQLWRSLDTDPRVSARATHVTETSGEATEASDTVHPLHHRRLLCHGAVRLKAEHVLQAVQQTVHGGP